MEDNDGPTTAEEADASGTTSPPPAGGTDRDVSTDDRRRRRIGYDVPANATVRPCPECGRPCPDETLLALHRGLDHGSQLSNGDRAAVEEARSTEERRLRRFRLRTLVVIVVLYFGLLMVYAVVT